MVLEIGGERWEMASVWGKGIFYDRGEKRRCWRYLSVKGIRRVFIYCWKGKKGNGT